MSNVIAGVGNIIVAESDVDFMIKGLLKFHLFGQELWITTTHVSMWIVSLILIGFAFVVNRKIKNKNPEDTPGMLQNIAELMVEKLDDLVHTIMGKNAKKYVNYIGTLFAFILLSNLSGLLGLRAPTADYAVPLPLALITFGMIQYNNVKYNKVGAFTNLFKPLPFLFPINLISEFSTPVSMSLRLFSNLLSGTVMLGLVYGLLPIFLKIGIPSILHVYFDIFAGAIQTYVFCMLTMVFVNDKITTE